MSTWVMINMSKEAAISKQRNLSKHKHVNEI